MTRQCGTCTLCCKLLPIDEIAKPVNTRCAHQSISTGCRIYASRPASCREWSCIWLTDPSLAGRPDRAHYVVDPVRITHEDGTVQNLFVVQVWIDPAWPSAHRDPALRAWLLRRQENGTDGGLAIVRYAPDQAILLAPPYLTDTGEWVECGSLGSVSLEKSREFLTAAMDASRLEEQRLA